MPDPNETRIDVLTEDDIVNHIDEIHDLIAWEAVWHFFLGGDDDFERLYERRMTDTHTQENEIYVTCSEILFEQEMYVANLLDEGDTKELLWVIKDLGSKIKEILEED